MIFAHAPDAAAPFLTPGLLSDIAQSRGSLDCHAAFPRREIGILGRIGALAAPLPRCCGGLGLGTCSGAAALAVQVLGDLGKANLSLARLYEGHVNAVKLVTRYGAPAQIRRMADDIAQGYMFAIWNTESGTGVMLEPVPQGYRLEGKKMFASGAGFLRRAIVTARAPDGGIVLVHAEIDPAVQPFSHAHWRLQGMQATATGEVDLTGIGVAADAIIGTTGDYLREPDFSAGAWRTLAAQLGAMRELYVLFLADLKHTGRGTHPIQRARLAEIAMACQTASLWVDACAYKAEGGTEQPASVVAFVNLARAAVSRAAEEIITRVQRGIGARAFLTSNPVEQVARDLAFYLRQPAPDQTFDEAAGFLLGHEACIS